MKGDIRVFTGNANPKLAHDVADYLDRSVSEAEVDRFSDGEIKVQIGENVRGADCFIIQPTCPPHTNRNLMELLIMIDALRRSSAGRITAVVPYFGYSRQELPHLNMLQFYANPDDRKDFLRRMAEAGHVEDEVRFKKKDGTVMQCQRATVARKDEHGNTIAYQGFIRDITEQKRAQEELRSSEEEYRSLFEASMDAVYVNAADGSHIRANQAWLDLFGYSRGDLQDLNIIAIYANP